MAGNFEALDNYLNDTITLPVKGKMYTINSPSAKDGLRIEAITSLAMQVVAGSGGDLDAEVLNDEDERNLYQLVLGPTYQQMLDDGVTWVWLRHVAQTALLWVNAGVEKAEQFWASAGNPEHQAPARENHQPRGSGSATSTRKQGSTSGTNRRRGTNRHQQARSK